MIAVVHILQLLIALIYAQSVGIRNLANTVFEVFVQVSL